MNKNNELKSTVIETIGNEVKDLLTEHYDKIEEYIKQSTSQSAGVGFSVTINKKNRNIVTKTRITYSQINKDSVEDEIGDPNQPEFDETDKTAPKARVPGKKKATKKAAATETEDVAITAPAENAEDVLVV